MTCKNKILTGILLMMVTAGSVLADQLPENWSNELKQSTRALMTQTGNQTQSMVMTKSMVQARYQERQIIQVQNRITASIDEGLPAEPLMLKVREGLVKQVNPDQMIQAMERVQHRYREAHRYAEHLADDQTRESVSDLIADIDAAGMNEKDLEKIVTSLRVRHSKTIRVTTRRQLNTESLVLARDLVRVGVTPSLAAEVVSGILKKGATVDELNEIADDLKANRNRSTANEQVMLCLQAIRQEQTVEQVMSRVKEQTRTSSSLSSSSGGQDNGNGNSGSSTSGSDSGNQGSSGSSGSGSDGSSGGSSGSSGSGSSGGSSGSGGSGSSGSGSGSSGGGGSGSSNGGGSAAGGGGSASSSGDGSNTGNGSGGGKN